MIPLPYLAHRSGFVTRLARPGGISAVFATAGEANECDLDLYQRMTNTLRRALEAIGLQRRAKDIGPSLSEYLAQAHSEQAAE